MNLYTATLPKEFIWRRLHSLMGLWIVIFLIEHLLTNSQAALLLGDNAQGFVRMVNWLHNLPYLHVIEIVLLGVPILIHMIWGVKYLFTSTFNSYKTSDSKPSLPEYGRNRAYTWQRITSWILLIGLIGHIVKFRFIEYPQSLNEGNKSFYFVKVNLDPGLYTVSERLDVTLFDVSKVEKEKEELKKRSSEAALVEAAEHYRSESFKGFWNSEGEALDAEKEIIVTAAQKFQQKEAFIRKLDGYQLSLGQAVAVSNDFGTATLLSVRDTFKSPIYAILYTIFVLAACFHGFNGLWTFMITWGVVLRIAAQKAMVNFSIGLMIVVAFLGLAAIWGTYFLNLKF